MLEFLWAQGKVTVAGRQGGQRLWDLSDRWFPDWTPRTSLHSAEAVRRAVLRSLGALGVATPTQITAHFTRGMYPGVARVIDRLLTGKVIQPVTIADTDTTWPGRWLIRSDDLPLLESLEGDGPARTTLLSPFDNLICDRARTELMFGFRYRTEFYVPRAKRQYGYYVMPVLRGDGLIGRADIARDPAGHDLVVKTLYAEPGAPPEAAEDIRVALDRLADFVGAERVTYLKTPPIWADALD